MSSFEEIIEHFSSEGTLTKLPAEKVELLRNKHSGIPESYLRFLEHAGFGNLGSISLYSGPESTDEVYPNAMGKLKEILLIGDDFQGYSFGFDPDDGWRIVEVSPRGEIDSTIETEFLALLDDYMQ